MGPPIQQFAFHPEHTTCSMKLSFLWHEIHSNIIIIIIININLQTKNYTLVFSNNILECVPQNIYIYVYQRNLLTYCIYEALKHFVFLNQLCNIIL